MTKLLRSYGCTLCQKRHYDNEQNFVLHLYWQSKEGIEMREKPKSIKQTNLLEYGFPDNIPKNLKLGEYRRMRDFTKTPEPKGE